MTDKKDVGWEIRYMTGDLFTCPPSHSLAHCISVDCQMGKGIAVLFRDKYGGIDELKKQASKPGDVAVLEREQRYIYYLITKPKYFDKPTYEDLKRSLESMREHCIRHSVRDVSMPRIGCGLDRLQWDQVGVILTEVFASTDINVTVYTK